VSYKQRRWPYRLLAVGLGFFLIFALEGVLRVLDIASNQEFVPDQLIKIVENGQIKGEIVRSGAPFFLDQGNEIMETNPIYHRGLGSGFPHSGSMRKIRFSKEPTKERYFLLGGSAALGQQPVNLKVPQTWKTIALGNSVYALPSSRSISGALTKNLAQKNRDVEILNAGMISQDSGGVRNLVSEVISYKPTGILLYMGNNEGIGMAYGVNGITLKRVPEMQVNLRKFRIYRVLRNTFAPEKLSASTTLVGTKPDVLGQLTQNEWRQAGKAQVLGSQSSDSVHMALMERWKTNIAAIQDLCDQNGVTLYIIATPPHILYPPFYSANSPDVRHQGIHQYSKILKTANDLHKSQSWNLILEETEKALSIEKNHSQGWFLHAEGLRYNQKKEEAISAYERALLLDLSRKRSRLEYTSATISFCKTNTCKSLSAHNALKKEVLNKGFGLYDQRFGDHEHLTPDGCSWVAELFATLITN
jgi:tetratricopeptide (TPR) repeat protein